MDNLGDVSAQAPAQAVAGATADALEPHPLVGALGLPLQHRRARGAHPEGTPAERLGLRAALFRLDRGHHDVPQREAVGLVPEVGVAGEGAGYAAQLEPEGEVGDCVGIAVGARPDGPALEQPLTGTAGVGAGVAAPIGRPDRWSRSTS